MADALNDMMGGSSEKGAVKVDIMIVVMDIIVMVDIIIVMVDIILMAEARCDIIVLSKLISTAMMTMEGNWNLLEGVFMLALRFERLPDPGRFALSVAHSLILSLKPKLTL